MLACGVSLLGGEPEPLDGLGMVLRHAFAAVVRQAEFQLCVGVSLLGFDSQPLNIGWPGENSRGDD